MIVLRLFLLEQCPELNFGHQIKLVILSLFTSFGPPRHAPHPVLLVYIVPVCKLANAVKQNMLWAEHSSSMGWRQSTLGQAWRIAGCFVRVVWTPWRCHHMWPLSVAVDGGRWCMIR